MKKYIILLFTLLAAFCLLAQPPQKMSYQAVVRDASGALVMNGLIGVRITILQNSPTGTVKFAETHTVVTNANGLATLEIGTGTPITGTLAGIDWATGPYFLKTDTDPNGGTNYSVSTSSQIMSVPYALYAERSAEITDGSIMNVDVNANAAIASSKISGDAGVEYYTTENVQSWAGGTYGIKTMAAITITAPTSGYVLLTHTGFAVFFSEGRTMAAGIGETATSMVTSVSFGNLDGSSTNRYEIPYSVTTVIPVTAGSHTYYALAEGNSVFDTGSVNMVHSSFVGVFIPKRY
ncbi:MAG: hypothetical protein WA004_10355 [Saprospiraceae bacterium]